MTDKFSEKLDRNFRLWMLSPVPVTANTTKRMNNFRLVLFHTKCSKVIQCRFIFFRLDVRKVFFSGSQSLSAQRASWNGIYHRNSAQKVASFSENYESILCITGHGAMELYCRSDCKNSVIPGQSLELMGLAWIIIWCKSFNRLPAFPLFRP